MKPCGVMHRSACSRDDPSYASQQTLFDDLGRELLDHAFEGYNTALFAVRRSYLQTEALY